MHKQMTFQEPLSHSIEKSKKMHEEEMSPFEDQNKISSNYGTPKTTSEKTSNNIELMDQHAADTGGTVTH